MILPLNPKSAIPLYIQLYQGIKKLIQENKLKKDERLPSKRQLAQVNGISMNTVINAYNQLLTEGYIYSIERSGYYISDIQLQFNIPTSNSPKTISASSTLESNILYDLARSTADTTVYPFSIFRKIYSDLLKEENDRILKVVDGRGLEQLRLSLHRYIEKSRGVPCHPDQILIGSSSYMLFNTLIDLLDDPNSIGIENPGYHGLNPLFTQKGLSIEPIKLDQYGLSLNELNRSNTSILYLTPNHQFPTGTIMPLERRQQILSWANKDKKRFIVEDDYDSEFKYSGIPVPSLSSLDTNQKVIYMGSFSRVLSTGLRISYMVLPKPLLNRYLERNSHLISPINTLEQWALHYFIQDGHLERHLNQARSFYKKKRDKLIQSIQSFDKQADIQDSSTGLHILFTPSIHFNGNQMKTDLVNRGIQLKLLSDFYYEWQKASSNTIFISFSSLPIKKIDNVVETIYSVIKSNEA